MGDFYGNPYSIYDGYEGIGIVIEILNTEYMGVALVACITAVLLIMGFGVICFCYLSKYL